MAIAETNFARNAADFCELLDGFLIRHKEIEPGTLTKTLLLRHVDGEARPYFSVPPSDELTQVMRDACDALRHAPQRDLRQLITVAVQKYVEHAAFNAAAIGLVAVESTPSAAAPTVFEAVFAPRLVDRGGDELSVARELLRSQHAISATPADHSPRDLFYKKREECAAAVRGLHYEFQRRFVAALAPDESEGAGLERTEVVRVIAAVRDEDAGREEFVCETLDENGFQYRVFDFSDLAKFSIYPNKLFLLQTRRLGKKSQVIAVLSTSAFTLEHVPDFAATARPTLPVSVPVVVLKGPIHSAAFDLEHIAEHIDRVLAYAQTALGLSLPFRECGVLLFIGPLLDLRRLGQQAPQGRTLETLQREVHEQLARRCKHLVVVGDVHEAGAYNPIPAPIAFRYNPSVFYAPGESVVSIDGFELAVSAHAYASVAAGLQRKDPPGYAAQTGETTAAIVDELFAARHLFPGSIPEKPVNALATAPLFLARQPHVFITSEDFAPQFVAARGETLFLNVHPAAMPGNWGGFAVLLLENRGGPRCAVSVFSCV